MQYKSALHGTRLSLLITLSLAYNLDIYAFHQRQ